MSLGDWVTKENFLKLWLVISEGNNNNNKNIWPWHLWSPRHDTKYSVPEALLSVSGFQDGPSCLCSSSVMLCFDCYPSFGLQLCVDPYLTETAVTGCTTICSHKYMYFITSEQKYRYKMGAKHHRDGGTAHWWWFRWVNPNALFKWSLLVALHWWEGMLAQYLHADRLLRNPFRMS